MNNEKIYYLGLDIGTDSVGYAVTDKKYNLLKFHGKQAWGVTLFDEASLQTDRRAFRTSRRRLDRRQQRVKLIQELFAKEIAKTDPRFFIRQQESFLFRKETDDEYILFNDADFSSLAFKTAFAYKERISLYDNSTSDEARFSSSAAADEKVPHNVTINVITNKTERTFFIMIPRIIF